MLDSIGYCMTSGVFCYIRGSVNSNMKKTTDKNNDLRGVDNEFCKIVDGNIKISYNECVKIKLFLIVFSSSMREKVVPCIKSLYAMMMR